MNHRLRDAIEQAVICLQAVANYRDATLPGEEIGELPNKLVDACRSAGGELLQARPQLARPIHSDQQNGQPNRVPTRS